MATFNEIYNNYLSGVQGIAPISGQQGITSLATPTNSNGAMDSSPTNTATATSAPTTMNAPFSTAFSMTPMDAVMAAVNPLGAIGTMAAKSYGYPSLGYALGAMTGLGSMGLGGAGGASNSSGSVDTGDMGSEAANDAANAAASQSASGGASSSDGGSTGGCGSFKDGGKITGASARPNFNLGGRIGYAEGSRDFPEFKEWMRGNQQGGIMELLDEYNRQKEQYQYSKKYPRDEAANGGRIGYLQGGLVSLLGDYYGKR